MNDDNTSERAVALVRQYLEVLQRVENVPASPVTTFLTAKRRRAFRRNAARLRQGKAEPRYKNLHTAEELAAICERTVQRDEMLERVVRDFQRITRDLGRVLEETPELQAWLRRRQNSSKRRQRSPSPRRVALAPDPSVEARWVAAAAEILTSLPSPEEAVIAIPPHGKDSGRGRVLIRIGIGAASWIGSFERGHKMVSTVSMLPDGKHLFVSVGGAGYVIDRKSRTLVETTGTEVIEVMGNEPLTLFVVNHNGMSLEAFGTTGRLWKTDTISSGGFRHMKIADGALVGEALHPDPVGWVRFRVKLATGEVEIDGRGVAG